MTQYYIRISDLSAAAGSDVRFSWTGQSPQHLAQALEQALAHPEFIHGWRDVQAEPDEVAPGLLEIDPSAQVSIEDRAQQVSMIVSTRLAHKLVAHRLNLLIGSHWTLGDVK